jgi:hypothetical protein
LRAERDSGRRERNAVPKRSEGEDRTFFPFLLGYDMEEDTMKRSILAIAAASLAVLMSTGAGAGGERQSLSQFLASCSGSEQNCTMMTYNVIQAGKSSRYLCVPRDVTLDQAAIKQLDWLRQEVQNNPRFGNEDLEEAQWTAAGKLWSCAKR